jgi:hypothetical protein
MSSTGKSGRFERDRKFDLCWDLWSVEGQLFQLPGQSRCVRSVLL